MVAEDGIAEGQKWAPSENRLRVTEEREGPCDQGGGHCLGEAGEVHGTCLATLCRWGPALPMPAKTAALSAKLSGHSSDFSI